MRSEELHHQQKKTERFNSEFNNLDAFPSSAATWNSINFRWTGLHDIHTSQSINVICKHVGFWSNKQVLWHCMYNCSKFHDHWLLCTVLFQIRFRLASLAITATEQKKQKKNQSVFFLQLQMKLKEAELHKANLCAKKVSLASHNFLLSKFSYWTIPPSSNAFSFNLAECLITDHYFKDIFLLYFMNITAR